MGKMCLYALFTVRLCVGEIGFPDSANRRGGNCRDDRNDGCLGHARSSCVSVSGPFKKKKECTCIFLFLLLVVSRVPPKMSFFFFFLSFGLVSVFCFVLIWHLFPVATHTHFRVSIKTFELDWSVQKKNSSNSLLFTFVISLIEIKAG